ncbi:SMC-Scp complex subunit ScpB [Apilactobacillus apisilvae]|uniref:SMC-Scp complex subunit ScpB n=1 Tax=Apilactobacillus apisilvae TaxID=2923364 RepID=A0ABY4PIV4_9LACO|nr:SMC-Scp complex subunit ScpB [Apilactobacillus apisilvae]UQS85425.1 SMC-Scp complex subunit ScpB [Apilactobacillus apisilvae]
MLSDLAKISGLIYISGDEGTSISKLQKATNISAKEIKLAIDKLKMDLDNDINSPFSIFEYNSKYLFATKSELDELLQKYIVNGNQGISLTQTSLEVLTIISYSQPITRIEIDDIRGVNSNKTIQKLIKQSLIKTNGHKEVPGNPKLYEVTDNFFKLFGLSSLEELPKIDQSLLTKEEK